MVGGGAALDLALERDLDPLAPIPSLPRARRRLRRPRVHVPLRSARHPSLRAPGRPRAGTHRPRRSRGSAPPRGSRAVLGRVRRVGGGSRRDRRVVRLGAGRRDGSMGGARRRAGRGRGGGAPRDAGHGLGRGRVRLPQVGRLRLGHARVYAGGNVVARRLRGRPRGRVRGRWRDAEEGTGSRCCRSRRRSSRQAPRSPRSTAWQATTRSCSASRCSGSPPCSPASPSRRSCGGGRAARRPGRGRSPRATGCSRSSSACSPRPSSRTSTRRRRSRSGPPPPQSSRWPGSPSASPGCGSRGSPSRPARSPAWSWS